MAKTICSNKYLQHNWIPYEKNTDWDVCTECGSMRKFISEISSGKYDEIGQSWVSEQRHLKPFENIGDKGIQVENINNKIDIELAINKLPKQQKRVAELVLEGYHLNEIAKKMGLSERTIKRYFRFIKGKLSPF